MATSIEWTNETWNPVTGCTKVSQGCKHCYAEVIANRKLPQGGFKDRPFTEVRCHPERLDIPFHWRKPRRVFVNSMSDLFHEDVDFAFISAVFRTCMFSEEHTFQVLTKRPERMLEYVSHVTREKPEHGAAGGERMLGNLWPLSNVWLGVSVENQATADERIPLLLQTPAAVRFVSYEPALAGVDFRLNAILTGNRGGPGIVNGVRVDFPGIDWLIVGGESGPGARPFDISWARSAIKQCRGAGVACFVKQLGAHPHNGVLCAGREWCRSTERWTPLRDRKGGDTQEWPLDLCVRQWPE